jgi:hypothetical protein
VPFVAQITCAAARNAATSSSVIRIARARFIGAGTDGREQPLRPRETASAGVRAAR